MSTNLPKHFFDPIVIGHNAFFGVDHLSSARGQEREAYFANPKNIANVIAFALESGAGGIMMSTHERAHNVTKILREDPKLMDGLRVYPLLPYVQKYVTAANEKGMISVILDGISGTSSTEKLAMAWNGAKGLLGRDIYSILTNLIQIELKTFRGLNVPCVFLHDAFTDLALALNMKGIVDYYHEQLKKDFGYEAAFATKNLPLFLRKFHEWGYSNPLVMPHLNLLGFSMNPSREACELALKTYSSRVMAMSTLASGYLKPGEAYAYLGTLPHVESVVVGASSQAHVAETFSAIKRNMSHLFTQ